MVAPKLSYERSVTSQAQVQLGYNPASGRLVMLMWYLPDIVDPLHRTGASLQPGRPHQAIVESNSMPWASALMVHELRYPGEATGIGTRHARNRERLRRDTYVRQQATSERMAR